MKIRQKKIFHTNVKEKTAEMTIYQIKTDFRPKTIRRHKEGHQIMKRGSINQNENKYICTKESTKGETYNNTIIV